MNKAWNISRIENGEGEITLYGVVGGGGWFSEGVTAADFADELNDLGGVSKITVRINSPGGDAFDGIAIYNILRAHSAEIVTRVEGLAASAASIVAMAGTVHMMLGSLMMIHNPWGVAIGEADDLRKTADVLDKIGASLVAIYEAKTGKSADELRELLAEETWMDPDEALAAGFADEIDDDEIEVEAANDASDVMVQAVAYARADVPMQILAMAKAPELVIDAEADLALADEDPEDEAFATAPAITVGQIIEIKADAKAEGIEQERERIRAVYSLLAKAGPGHSDLAARAMFDEPMTAEAVAVAIIDSEQHSAQVALAAAKLEAPTIGDSTDPNTIAAGSLPVSDNTQRAHINAAMVAGGNATRGGN